MKQIRKLKRSEPYKLTPGTWAYWASIRVEFDCDSEPEIVGGPSSVGLSDFGFIFSFGREITDPVVAEVFVAPCESRNCRNAKRYHFKVLYTLQRAVGFGFNFGEGTGTFGAKLPPEYLRSRIFMTPCLCCDDAGGPIARSIAAQSGQMTYSTTRKPNPVAGVIAGATFAGSTVAALLYPDHWLAQAYLATCGVLAVLSLALIGPGLKINRSKDDDPDEGGHEGRRRPENPTEMTIPDLQEPSTSS
jgi:hypothetical protein